MVLLNSSPIEADRQRNKEFVSLNKMIAYSKPTHHKHKTVITSNDYSVLPDIHKNQTAKAIEKQTVMLD